MAEDAPKSRHPILQEPPEFKATVPEHLLKQMSESERYMVEAISRQEQQFAWVTSSLHQVDGKVIITDTQLQEVHRDVKKINEWRTFFSGRWAVVSALAVVILTGLASAAFRALFQILIK